MPKTILSIFAAHIYHEFMTCTVIFYSLKMWRRFFYMLFLA